MIAAVADTHTIIWYVFGSPALSEKARNFIEQAAQAGQQIAISSITLVEMVYLIEKGRIAAESLSRIARNLETQPTMLLEIPLDLTIVRTLSQVDIAQVSDLPDRIIAATALNLGVPLISRDAKIQLSSVTTVW
jgi:Uncharacterized protein conserved in bacteria